MSAFPGNRLFIFHLDCATQNGAIRRSTARSSNGEFSYTSSGAWDGNGFHATGDIRGDSGDYRGVSGRVAQLGGAAVPAGDGTLDVSYQLVFDMVAAEEEALKFRLITRTVNSTFVDAPDAEGRKLGVSQNAGVAIFEDGRIADKQFVFTMDNRGAEGDYAGYSTYTFRTGDSLTLSFEGGWGPDGAGGDYKVLSGTGAYEGASGRGRFDPVKEPWKNASLWDVKIKVMRGGG